MIHRGFFRCAMAVFWHFFVLRHRCRRQDVDLWESHTQLGMETRLGPFLFLYHKHTRNAPEGLDPHKRLDKN